jgi:hypothetical protein
MGVKDKDASDPRDADGVEGGRAPDGVQGEGDYRAARKFQQEEHTFAMDDERVDEAAREAADALDGPEGEELERARQASARGEAI